MMQYIVKPAYTGNSSVITYTDGKIQDKAIIADYQVDGYVEALENLGYSRAYVVSYYEKKLKEAEEDLMYARQAYELAMQHPLEIAE